MEKIFRQVNRKRDGVITKIFEHPQKIRWHVRCRNLAVANQYG